MRRLLPLLALLVVLPAAAAAPSTPQPGLWAFENRPERATLDGRPLGDLPYTPPDAPQQVCLTPAQAADPAAWLARDQGAGCTFSRRLVAGGRVDIAATCPSPTPGYAAGTLRLTGTASADAYSLRFVTETTGENGRMGFTGTMTGRRLGACP